MKLDSNYARDILQAGTFNNAYHEKRVKDVEAFEQILLKTVYLKSLINDNSETDEENEDDILPGNTSQYNEMIVDLLSQQLAQKDILNLQGINKKSSEKPN